MPGVRKSSATAADRTPGEMNVSDAIEMIRDAVGVSAGVWADLGAGTGTFTRALTEVLGAGSTVYAVDGDARAVRALRELSSSSSSTYG